MAPLALAAAYVGGAPFAAFWGIAAIGVWWEWSSLVIGRKRQALFMAGALTLAGAFVALTLARLDIALIVVGLGVVLVGALAPDGRRVWCAAGVAYASALASTLVLRADPAEGFVAIVFLFVVVWVTDILAYFVGRALGGPKLWPSISPKKTWSGAIGGAFAATVAGVALAHIAGMRSLTAIALVALALSAVAQAGDLFESWVKRRFGTKDASRLIPGHGGLMDRLDGFLAATFLAVIIGLLRGGQAEPARGLLVW
jgi:phosphatidate cytidylyltransferase